jgi:hypothetical protein
MAPINDYTYGLVKKYFQKNEKFTSRQLIDRVEEDLPISRQKYIMKTLGHISDLGFLKKNSVKYTNWYYWDIESNDLFESGKANDQPIKKLDDFEQEHCDWVKMVERRKQHKEYMKALVNRDLR